LLGSYEFDELLQEDADLVRAAFEETVLSGTALGVYPPVRLPPDNLRCAFVWVDADGDFLVTKPSHRFRDYFDCFETPKGRARKEAWFLSSMEAWCLEVERRT